MTEVNYLQTNYGYPRSRLVGRLHAMRKKLHFWGVKIKRIAKNEERA
jgi:hypothetical protein